MTAGIATLPFEVTSQPLVPTGGLYDYKKAADMLAGFGREGDTYIVHAAEGETVIPMEVLQANPRMKNMLFQQMEEMGLEPESYVVGNKLNSINPVTGKPEFFLKKLFGSLKKVVKKIAPIALAIAAPYLLPTMPLFLSAGIGSFAGNMVSGASVKDSFKSALMAGAMAGAGSAAFGKGFGATGVESGLTTDYNLLGGGTPPPTQTSALQGPFATEGGLKGLRASSPGKSMSAYNPSDVEGMSGIQSLNGQPAPFAPDGVNTFKDPSLFQQSKNFANEYIVDPITNTLGPNRLSIQPTNLDIQNKIAQDMKLHNMVEANNMKIAKEAGVAYKPNAFKPNISAVRKSLAPGALRKYAPLAGVGAAGMYLAGGFDEEKPEPQIDPITGEILLNEDIASGAYNYGFDPSTFYGNNPYYAAGGGSISGPGTPTSDSIPAMLSDGEFVMNAKAVRGAGNGNRKQGAKKMYAMMRNFERGAA
tara:strand:+ start:2690 stop:4117 length:1428 start_codon:yes stop_codon:yes gene_type:complete